MINSLFFISSSAPVLVTSLVVTGYESTTVGGEYSGQIAIRGGNERHHKEKAIQADKQYPETILFYIFQQCSCDHNKAYATAVTLQLDTGRLRCANFLSN
jgi:hypothetical protein